MSKGLINFRAYQRPVFSDRTTGTELLHWSRQIGKSFTLAAWAVDRCLSRPGRLITVLSNSKDNGAEFAVKAGEVLRKLDEAFEIVDEATGGRGEDAVLNSPVKYDDMRFETRITVGGKVSRIKVLAANPRTARGFSGDLVMDEFAFHENSNAIWEAAEPILSSNRDFLCRIASTGNGKHNMFYRMAAGGCAGGEDPTLVVSDSGFLVSRVPRSLAWKMGVKIYDAKTRAEITPDQARERSLDKRAYDQNYECAFADENMALLTHELISSAEDNEAGVLCDQDWTGRAQDLLLGAQGELYAGLDVGRKRDLSFLPVGEKVGGQLIVRAALRMENMRLPQQQKRLELLMQLPKFRGICIDMTGIGLGLFEYAEDKFGARRVHGINFGSSVPVTEKVQADGRKAATIKVTEAMATELLARHEERSIKYPCDEQMRDDLRKPEKITTPGGRVSIAAVRDEAGHADHFWGIALMCEAAHTSAPFAYQSTAPGRGRQLTRRGKVPVV